MTEDVLATNTLIPAIKENAEALGLKWQLRVATVIYNTSGVVSLKYDGGDEVETRAVPLVDNILPTDRVMVMNVPPSGNYVIGFANADRPGAIISRCTADTANTSDTSFITATGMTAIPLRANISYRVEIWIVHLSAASTTGIRLRINYSGTVDESQFIGMIQTGAATSWSRVFPSANQDGAWASADSFTTGSVDFVSGYILPGSDGDLTLQFRSEVSGSAVTIRAGSFVDVRRTAVA